MNKILIAVAIAGACAAAPASAQWYIGGGIGAAQAKLGSYSPAVGVGVGGTSNRDTSYKIFGGYQFTPNWGIEGQYSDLGKYDYTVSQAGASSTGSYRVDQWSLAGTGTLPLSSNFYLMGKLGVSSNHVRASAVCVPLGCTSSSSGNKSDLLAGIGIGYNFNKNIGVRFEYENFGKMANVSNGGGSIKGDNWALSVKYSF
jgi:OOP family OmpA-OmpF porin